MELTLSQDLINSFLYAGIITLVFALAFFLVNWTFPKLHSRIESFANKHITSLRFRNFEIISAHSLKLRILEFLKLVRFLLYAFGLYFYLSAIFAIFPQTKHISANMLAYILNPLGEVFATIIS